MSKPCTETIRALLDPIARAKQELANAEDVLHNLKGNGGISVDIVLEGRSIPVVEYRANGRGYTATSPGRQALRDALIAEQQQHLIGVRSKLEGLLRQLAVATKALQQESLK